MLVFTIYLIFSMLAVLWFDLTRYLIPNWLNGALLILYPVAVLMSPTAVDWQGALLAMAIVFAVGYGVFAMRWMGGGDIKLITVCALWVGMQHLLDFIFLFALLGGAFSVVVLILRKLLPLLGRDPAKLPRILRDKEPIPYGVAISIGFLLMIWMQKIPVLAVQ